MRTVEAEYFDYMSFTTPEDPWDVERIQHCLEILLDHESVVEFTVEERDSIRDPYDNPEARFYHNPFHGGFVGSGEIPETLVPFLGNYFTRQKAGAILTIAGLFHDIAYKQVDADRDGNGYWPEAVENYFRGLISCTYKFNEKDGKRYYTTHLTEEGRADDVTRMVAHIFGVTEKGIIHNEGGNEFDSALAAAKFLERKGVHPTDIVAVVTAIANTIPFRPSIGFDEFGNLTNAFTGEIAQRVHTAQLQLGDKIYVPSWGLTDAMMCMGVYMGHRDTAVFTQKDNSAAVAEGGRRVKAEENYALRELQITISGLVRAARLMQSAPGLHHMLSDSRGEVSASTVPTIYFLHDTAGNLQGTDYSYPPKPIYDLAVQYTEENATEGARFFQVHELGITFAACIGTLLGRPDAAVPGIVDSDLWQPHAIPTGLIADNLSEKDVAMYREHMFGANQTGISRLTPPRSPISGLIFGAAGWHGAWLLSRSIQATRKEAEKAGEQDPFSRRDRAAAFVRQVRALIGRDNFNTLMGQLIHVAEEYEFHPNGEMGRPAALENLRVEYADAA